PDAAGIVGELGTTGVDAEHARVRGAGLRLRILRLQLGLGRGRLDGRGEAYVLHGVGAADADETDVVDLLGSGAELVAVGDLHGLAVGGRDLDRVLVGGDVGGDHHAVVDAGGVGEGVRGLPGGTVGGLDETARGEAHGGDEVLDGVGLAGAEAGDAFHLRLRGDHVEGDGEGAGLRLDGLILPDVVGRRVVRRVVAALGAAVGLPHVGDERLDAVLGIADVALLVVPEAVVVVEGRGPVPLLLEAHQAGGEDVAERAAAGDGAVVGVPVATVAGRVDLVLLAPLGDADVVLDVLHARAAVLGVKRAADVGLGDVPGRHVFLEALAVLGVGHGQQVVVTQHRAGEEQGHLATLVVATVAGPAGSGLAGAVDVDAVLHEADGERLLLGVGVVELQAEQALAERVGGLAAVGRLVLGRVHVAAGPVGLQLDPRALEFLLDGGEARRIADGGQGAELAEVELALVPAQRLVRVGVPGTGAAGRDGLVEHRQDGDRLQLRVVTRGLGRVADGGKEGGAGLHGQRHLQRH